MALVADNPTVYREGWLEALAAVQRVSEHWEQHAPTALNVVGAAWVRRAVGVVREGWCCDLDHPGAELEAYTAVSESEQEHGA